jgi:predicted Zn-dependent protease
VRPDLASEEGGLWALMDREEQRVRRSPLRIADESLNAYLTGISCRLAAQHCPDIRVHVLRIPYFNASMAPNGMMTVWSGLLLRIENEAQLAAILAHELAHYLQRHSLQQLQDAKARTAFATLLVPLGLAGLVGQLVVLGGALAFSRDQEREADALGVTMMRQAGYDTRQAPMVWANLLAELEANPDADPRRDSVLFATHPPSDERRRSLEALAAGSGGEVGAAAYAGQLAPLRFDLLDDELRRGRFDESLVLLDRLLAGEPGNAGLLYFRGEARRLRGAASDLPLAQADLEAARQAGDAPAAAHRSLGHVYKATQQPEEARRAWQRYLEAAPKAADALLVRQLMEELP